MIFDTDVLISFLRGDERARDVLERTPYGERLISSLTLMELIQGCRDKKEVKIVRHFVEANFSHAVPADDVIFAKAMTLLERYALSHGLRTVDALIAATAMHEGQPLCTGNARHFAAIKGLKIKRFPHSMSTP